MRAPEINLSMGGVLAVAVLAGLGIAGAALYVRSKAGGPGAADYAKSAGAAAVGVADGAVTGVVGAIGEVFGLPKPESLSSNPCDCNWYGSNCTASAWASFITGGCKHAPGAPQGSAVPDPDRFTPDPEVLENVSPFMVGA